MKGQPRQFQQQYAFQYTHSMSSIVEKPVACIAVGLFVLICGQLWPAVPVVAGAALVACGACLIAPKRQSVASIRMVSQLVVYSSLVTLFLGARLHTASIGNYPLGPIDLLDFSLAAILMSLTFWKTLGSLLPSGNAR